MAMNKIALGSSIKSKLADVSSKPGDPTYEVDVWTAIAEAIIDHIKNNAEIHSLPNEGITASGGIVTPAVISAQGQTVKGQKAIS